MGEIIFDHETGLPASSKEDRKLHDLGMENIQRCVKKYMGDIDITILDTSRLGSAYTKNHQKNIKLPLF